MKTVVPDNSYAVQFLATEERYYTQYSYQVAFMITEEVDYSKLEVQNQLDELISTLESSGLFYGPNLTDSWLLSFLRFSQANSIPVGKEHFIKSLQQFLKMSPYEMYKSDVKFNKDSTAVIASRFFVTAKDMVTLNHEKDMMLESRHLADTFNFSMTAYHPRFIYFDQFLVIRSNTIQNILIATGCMLIVSLLLIPQLVCCIWVALCIVSITVGVVGYMALWNIPLDAVSMICIIMCIGFSVDFSAHMTYAYVIAEGTSFKERVSSALGGLGLPIVQGAMSSILAVSVLADAEANVFRVFFKIVLLVNILGFLHAVFVLPVLFSIAGPRTRHTVKDTKSGPCVLHTGTKHSPMKEVNPRIDSKLMAWYIESESTI